MADNFNYNLIAYIGREPDYLKEITIEWTDKNTPVITFWDATALGKAQPTIDQLKALDTQATKLENNAKADANRKTEYLSWEEQLDYIYHNGITKWKTDHIKPIKDKYPKEE
jgi:hypothetical protein